MSKLSQRKFQRKKEDFTCERCGFFVHGDGYTNHCQKCLWSKHVDMNPGDRQEKCKGMMEPVSLEFRQNEYILIHQCLSCGIKKRNRVAKSDDFRILMAVSSLARVNKARPRFKQQP